MSLFMTPQTKLELMTKCPITLRDAAEVCGFELTDLNNDDKRGTVIAVHTLICEEWAESVIVKIYERK
jgi:hypothetical protein